MASNGVNRNALAHAVTGILETSKVSLGRKSKARTQLLEQVRREILGAPKADRRDCVVRKGEASKGKTKLLVSPGGAVQMTSAESQRTNGR